MALAHRYVAIYPSNGGTTTDPTETAAWEFNKEAEARLSEISRGKLVPTRRELNALREDVWKYRNPGKTPKQIRDIRYRTMPVRQGKTNRGFGR